MKKGLTEIVFILDRSGSMHGLEADTIGGFNSMMEKQKKDSGDDGEAYVSTVLFDDFSRVLHDRIPIENVPEMTDNDYYVGGCTALLDALGGAIHHIGNIHKYARKEDVPEKTLFVIITDGMENASRNYSYEMIQKMVKRQQKKVWLGIHLHRSKYRCCHGGRTLWNKTGAGGELCVRRGWNRECVWSCRECGACDALIRADGGGCRPR